MGDGGCGGGEQRGRQERRFQCERKHSAHADYTDDYRLYGPCMAHKRNDAQARSSVLGVWVWSKEFTATYRYISSIRDDGVCKTCMTLSCVCWSRCAMCVLSCL